MKKDYISPELEIEKFTVEYVITTSGDGQGGGQGGGDEEIGLAAF